MDAASIFGHVKDPAEDYYGILGCDQSATKEQILCEYKHRAKECHPDKSKEGGEKCEKECLEKFQRLQVVSMKLIFMRI